MEGVRGADARRARGLRSPTTFAIASDGLSATCRKLRVLRFVAAATGSPTPLDLTATSPEASQKVFDLTPVLGEQGFLRQAISCTVPVDEVRKYPRR